MDTRRLALVVDDDPVLHRAMISQLVCMEFEAIGAFHYDAAIEHMAVRKPHLVCLDVGLPTQSGYELCEHIRGALGWTTVLILMMCDSGLPEDMANAELAGANAFLKKPFSMHELRAYVEVLLDPKKHGGERYVRRLQV